MSRPQPSALLFDLGGVVIDIDFDRAFTTWQPRSRLSLQQIREAFGFDLHYERYERGEIAAADYFDHLSTLLQIERDHAHIAEGWNAIFLGEIAETTAMVRAVRAHVPCYAFSNTNAAHAVAWSSRFPAVVQAFDRVFTSHEIGLRKPERAAFHHIAKEIGVAPASIVFFDDLQSNVDGALAAGLQAVHVRSPADVRLALSSFGYTVA